MSALTVEGVAVGVTTRTTIGDSAVGVRRRAKSGVMRSHKLGDVRTGQIHTDFMSGTDATILRAILASPGPVLHGGTLLGADAYFHVSGVQQQPLGADLWLLSWRIEETGFTPSPLLFSFDAVAPGAAFTFTRAGVAPLLDVDGSYQEAATNVARYSYLTEEVAFAGGGVFSGVPTEHGRVLLLEPAGTNVWLRSDEFDAAAWTKAQATIDADDAAAPDGTTTADKLVESTDAGVHTVEQALGGSPTDDEYSVISVHAKADERERIWMSLTGKDGSTVATARYDLVAGGIAAVSSGGSLTTLAAIRDAGDGWYRCILAGDVLTGGSTPSGLIGLVDDSNQTSYTGDGTSGVHLWRGHAEVDRRAPSYAVQTVGATAAGVAEKMTAPPGFTMEDIRAAGGATFYQEWIERGTAYVVGSSTRYWQVSDDVQVALFSNSLGDGTLDGALFEAGGVSAVSSPSAVIPLGSPAEARLVLYLDDDDDWKVQLGVSVNGAAEVLGSVATFGATLPDFDADLLTFGADHNQNVHAPVGLRTIKGIGGVRTMAEMQKIAAARLYQRVT
jgi:hypothetical protein